MAEQLLTIYGRMPVLEALQSAGVDVSAVFVARNARGDSIDDIIDAAEAAGLKVQRVAPERVTRISGNGRHDQGVAAEVVAHGLRRLAEWVTDAPLAFRLFLLDGVTNPSNVGMIVRTAVAAGFDGVVVPMVGVAEIGPLVIKASAGVVFRAPLLRVETASAAVALLREAGTRIIGLDGAATASIYDVDLSGRIGLVLGNETDGVQVEVDEAVAIPLRGGVESLNVATAAAVAAFEVARRSSD